MPRRRCSFLLCAGLISSLLGQTPSPSATAKTETALEAIVFEHISRVVRFDDDGSGVQDTTVVVRTQSQAGVQELGQLILGYSSATENLQIDYVRVRKPDGQIVETPASNAQDFALDVLREAPTYSDYRQRHVSVVGLQAGDVLEYHTVTRVSPLAPGEFWYEHVFPKQWVVQDEHLEIDVPKAREVKLKSPDHKYDLRETWQPPHLYLGDQRLRSGSET